MELSELSFSHLYQDEKGERDKREKEEEGGERGRKFSLLNSQGGSGIQGTNVGIVQ